jgi:hypothetical protein
MMVRRVSCAVTILLLMTAHAAVAGSDAQASGVRNCTMATSEATVQATIANAAEFCELLSQALASDVFRSPVLVTPEQLWHYAGTVVACRFQFRGTAYRITVHQSRAACSWFARHARGWTAARAG